MLLTSENSIEIIAEANRGEAAACQLFMEKQPDVVVLDLSMPGTGGLECIRRICNRDPNAKILVFSVHDESVYVSRAMEADAKGYITKNSAPETLVDAIQKIAAGDIYIEAGLEKTFRTHQSAYWLCGFYYPKTSVSKFRCIYFNHFKNCRHLSLIKLHDSNYT